MKKIAVIAALLISAITAETTLAKADKACATQKVVRVRANPNVTYITGIVDAFENLMIDPNQPPSRYYMRTSWMSAAVMRVDIDAGTEARHETSIHRFTDNRYTTRFYDGFQWSFEAPCNGNLIRTWLYITLYDLNGKFVESLKIDINENK